MGCHHDIINQTDPHGPTVGTNLRTTPQALTPLVGSVVARKGCYHYQYRELDPFSYYNGRFYAAKQVAPIPWQAAGELKGGVPTQVDRQ